MPGRLRYALSAVPLAAAALALGGCGDGSSTVGEAPAQTAATTVATSSVVLLDPTEAHGLVATGKAQLIDVRTPAEYAESHIEGATLIDLQAADFGQRIGELDPNATYVVYCHSGNRSAQATALMAAKGFTAVKDVDGGIAAWEAAGLPVVRPPHA